MAGAFLADKDFQDFVIQLQTTRNVRASAGIGYAISDPVFKFQNHLLFSNSILQHRVRVRALPPLVYENTKVDAPIDLLSTWASLVAEGRVKPLLESPVP